MTDDLRQAVLDLTRAINRLTEAFDVQCTELAASTLRITARLEQIENELGIRVAGQSAAPRHGRPMLSGGAGHIPDLPR